MCVSGGNLKFEDSTFTPRKRTDLKWTLIECSPTVLRPTQTGDLLVLDGELVVVRDLLVDVDGLSGVDHDLLLRLHCDDLRITVRLKEKTDRIGLLQSLCSCLIHKKEQRVAGCLTLQLWLMNRAKLPHLVASMMVSWSTRNM